MRTTTDYIRHPIAAVTKKEGTNYLWVQITLFVLGLLAFGLVEVFSASRYKAIEIKGDPYYFGFIHLFFVVGSLFVMLLMQVFPIKFWKKLTWIAFIAIALALLSVFFFPAENGAHRWVPIGNTGFNIQPSEFAKIVSIFVGAYIFSTVNWNTEKKYGDHLLKFLITSIPILYIFTTILFEPDLGNIVIIGAAYFVMYLLSNSKWRKSDLYVIGIGVVLIGVLAFTISNYRMERLATYITFMRTGEIQDEYGKGMQLRNILIGVGSGGWQGKGIGGSRLRQGYFVEVTAFTDSIAAVIFEELGFILSIFFVGIYLYLCLLILKVAEAQTDQYTRLLVWGIAIWFIGQALFHFGANVALIPVKGTTLPFISYGGSSLLALAVAMGIVIKVARNT